MRQLIFIFLIIPFLTVGQTNKAFKAILIDYSTDKIPHYCGTEAYATTLKFQLAERMDTLAKGQNILLKIICPMDKGIDLYKNNFEYNITTYGDTEEEKKHTHYGWNMFYKYENENLPRFWCKHLEMTNNSR